MFRSILVPLDGSYLAEGILPHVMKMATAFGARVTLLHVAETPAQSDVDVVSWRLRMADAEAYLRQQSDLLQAAGLTVESHLLEGPPADRIVEYAGRCAADLTILSRHGSGGPSAWQVSNVAQKVLQRGLTSILLVDAGEGSRALGAGTNYQRILVPLDGSQRAECVLPAATVLANQEKVELLLAHVTSRPFVFDHLPPSAEEDAASQRLIIRNRDRAYRYLKERASGIGANVRIALPIGDSVALALYQLLAQEMIDLVLLSAHGHSGQSQWVYGSVVSNFITNSSVPLLIVQDLPQSLRDQPYPAPTRAEALFRPDESGSILSTRRGGAGKTTAEVRKLFM